MTSLYAVAAGAFGAVVGSFLNACIHRMPRGIGLDNPRRSFCPSCKKTIPWYENLPVLSWVALRGKCSSCGARISPRYVLVEILTAALFVAVWYRFGLPLTPVYCLFVALLIVATFIDFEHFIIPDEITWGGTVAGIVFSLVFPSMMDATSWWASGLLSLAGAALGFGLLWLVVEFGKLAFGKKRHALTAPEDFVWIRDGDRADLTVGGEKLTWEDIFSRETDVLLVEAEGRVLADDRELPAGPLRFFYDRVICGEEVLPLDKIDRISGRATALVIPREAMGFGDVKFIACIGAFLGWQAVLFTIFAASIIGCAAGLGGLFLARDRSGTRLPFGPFLALGALVWLFAGHEVVAWYFSHFRGLSRGAEF
jgi:leader peptidase (prepilin peptidase)/N-methyltransferase